MNFNDLKELIIKDSKDLEKYIIETRRYFHKHPETMYSERKTAKFVKSELSKIGYDPKRIAGTGVLAVLEGENKKQKSNTIALRADMDALNIKEENNVIYRSTIPGKMHACGHDAHMAALLGAAQTLYKYKKYLSGTVKFIFQPAEEGGAGGNMIVEEGILDDVDYIFGIHVWIPLKSGIIGLRKGGLMASSDLFKISITGKGGHAAFPYLSIDPTILITELSQAFQTLVTREIDPLKSVVITPVYQGSKADNIIPSKAFLSGTLRTFDMKIREYIIKRMKQIIESYCKAWRCEGSISFQEPAYPVVINDEKMIDDVKAIFHGIFPTAKPDQTMGGEDFAFYQQKTKGVFIFLGIYNKEKGIIYPHHHPKFDIDEDVLWKGTVIYTILGFYHNFLK